MSRPSRSPADCGQRSVRRDSAHHGLVRWPLLDAASDLLLGAACPACGTPGWGLCVACRRALDAPVRHLNRGLGVPLVASGPYRPVLCHAIPRFKDDGALNLTRPLGECLARAVAALAPPPDTVLVPVPSRPAVVRARGYDHAARLAATAARRAGLAHARQLRRLGGGQDQAGLGRADRAANLAHTMTAARGARPVIIVDDITTTGASLREALRALTTAGAQVLGAAVIADADYS